MSRLKQSLKNCVVACGLKRPAKWLLDRVAPIAEYFGARRDRAIFDRYLRHSQGPRKLHLGCGGNGLEGWLNTDYYRDDTRSHLDVTKRFPFPDGSFDFAFSEHMIEHISYTDARTMISECFRVLKLGGVLRLSTPDFQFLVRLYAQPDTDVHRDYVAWNGKTFLGDAAPHDVLSVINNDMRDWGHKYLYDVDGLSKLLIAFGFRDVRSCEMLESEHPELAGLENVSRMPDGMLALVSLVLEARKP